MIDLGIILPVKQETSTVCTVGVLGDAVAAFSVPEFKMLDWIKRLEDKLGKCLLSVAWADELKWLPAVAKAGDNIIISSVY